MVTTANITTATITVNITTATTTANITTATTANITKAIITTSTPSARRRDEGGEGEGASSHGGGFERRSRAGTLTRRDTGHGMHAKHPKSQHDHDRQSVGKQSEGHTSLVEYENTYKLEPDSRFQETKIKEIIAKVLKENLTDKSYDARVMSRRCLELSEVIKERVKQLDMRRFKIVCLVIIGQNSEQSLMVSSRCLWNFAYDNFTSFTLKREPYYAVGMVFATYTE